MTAAERLDAIEQRAASTPSGGPERSVARMADPSRDVRELVAAHRAVLALHKPRTVKCIPAECYDHCPHEEQGTFCPDVEVTVCAECWDVAEQADEYFAESDGWGHLAYPCQTVRAIEEALR